MPKKSTQYGRMIEGLNRGTVCKGETLGSGTRMDLTYETPSHNNYIPLRCILMLHGRTRYTPQQGVFQMMGYGKNTKRHVTTRPLTLTLLSFVTLHYCYDKMAQVIPALLHSSFAFHP